MWSEHEETWEVRQGRGGCIPSIAHGMRKHQIWSGTSSWRRCQVLLGGAEGTEG